MFRCVSQWMRFLVLIASVVLISGVAADGDGRGALDSLKESYDDLPDSGKFVTGAAIGFTVTRFTVNKVVTVVKLAGATFLA
jgi:hypothetical protein